MHISYKKLWKKLIDKDMKKRDLMSKAQLSSSTVVKLSHGENVSTATLVKICKVLDCDISEVMEIISDDKTQIISKGTIVPTNNMPYCYSILPKIIYGER